MCRSGCLTAKPKGSAITWQRPRVFRPQETRKSRTSFYEEFSARSTLPFSHTCGGASRKMPDDYMDSIEPFDYAGLKPFSIAYLPGFSRINSMFPSRKRRSRADKTLSAVAVGCAAGDRAKRPSVYLSHADRRDGHLKRTGDAYALLPVWMLNTRWNGKELHVCDERSDRTHGR